MLQEASKHEEMTSSQGFPKCPDHKKVQYCFCLSGNVIAFHYCDINNVTEDYSFEESAIMLIKQAAI